MKQKFVLLFLMLAAANIASPALAVEPKKGEVPATLCITTETTKMHEGIVATYEKDIAPYKDNADAQQAITSYKEKIDAAWEALQQPYCGYGDTKSLKSTKKSYNKSVTRARSNFSEAVKNLQKAKVVAPAPEKKEAVPSKTENPTKTDMPTTGTLRSGLARGQRSDAVLELQKKLAVYFKLSDPASIQTGYFGPKTEELLIKFQIEQQIIKTPNDPGAGMVGPKTLKALLSV